MNVMWNPVCQLLQGHYTTGVLPHVMSILLMQKNSQAVKGPASGPGSPALDGLAPLMMRLGQNR